VFAKVGARDFWSVTEQSGVAVHEHRAMAAAFALPIKAIRAHARMA
jgi:hypothetical protein